MLGVGAGDVAADQLLAGRGHLEQLRVLVFDGHVGGTAQQLPDDGAEVVGDPFADELLGRNGVKNLRNRLSVGSESSESKAPPAP